MINVEEIVNDPDFAQPFTILRSTGSFQRGGWVDTKAQVPMYGSIQVAKEKELHTLPEGDRVSGAMSFHSQQPIYETQANVPEPSQTISRISDLITWRGQPFRIVKVFPWEDFGFYKAIGVRTTGT